MAGGRFKGAHDAVRFGRPALPALPDVQDPVVKALRLRLEFDGAIQLGEQCACRRSWLLVPSDLNFVSDLLHHLHHRFALPRQPLALSVDGFALFPSQHLVHVLRPGDRLLVRPSSTAPAIGGGRGKRRRQEALALPWPALWDGQGAAAGGGTSASDTTPARTGIEAACSESVVLAGFDVAELADGFATPQSLVSAVVSAVSRRRGDRGRGCKRKAFDLGKQAARCEDAVSLPDVADPLHEVVACAGTVATPPAAVTPAVEVKQQVALCTPATARRAQLAKPALVVEQVAAARARSASEDHRLRAAIREQVEFYFGDNYDTDNFLMSQADQDGWTPFKLVSRFNRMKELTDDMNLIKDCVENSAVVEISDCGRWVRRRL